MSALISAAELQAELGLVTVLDVRWEMSLVEPAEGEALHQAGHVPGASYVDLSTDLADPPGSGDRGRHPLPGPERFAEAMRAKGVSGNVPVVVYDGVAGNMAARAWWLLRYFGHPDVRLLNGGWAAWQAAGGTVETGAVHPSTGDFVARPGAMPVLDAAAAARLATAGVLIDARAPERFRGETEPLDPVAGHIPGAVNVPTSLNLAPAGSGGTTVFRDPTELAEVYGPLLAAGAPVGVYCGSGVTAALDVLALSLLGVEAALYPGSWSEWVSDSSRPVATGP